MEELPEPLEGANLVVRDGVFAGVARGGLTLRGTLAALSSEQVAFEFEIDGRQARPGYALADPFYGRVRSKSKHRGELKLSMSYGKPRWSGEIVFRTGGAKIELSWLGPVYN